MANPLFPYIPLDAATAQVPLQSVAPLPIVNPATFDAEVKAAVDKSEMFRAAPAQMLQEQNRLAQEKNQLALQGMNVQAAQAEQPNVLAGVQLKANLISQLRPGSTQFDLATAERYHQLTGNIALGQDGKLDMPVMRAKIEEERQKAETLAWWQAQNKLSPPLSAADRLKEQNVIDTEITSADTHLAKIQKARGYVTEGAVGPLPGSVAGKAWNWLTATASKVSGGAVGSAENYNAQTELMMTLSNDILAAASQMKGNLSDKDVRFLTSMFPKLTSTDEVWGKYLDRSEKILTTAKANALARRQALLMGQPAPPPKDVDWAGLKMTDYDWSADHGGLVTPQSGAAAPAVPAGSEDLGPATAGWEKEGVGGRMPAPPGQTGRAYRVVHGRRIAKAVAAPAPAAAPVQPPLAGATPQAAQAPPITINISGSGSGSGSGANSLTNTIPTINYQGWQ